MTENLRGYIIPESWMYFNDNKPMSYMIFEDIFYFCMIYPALIVIINIFSKSNLISLSGLTLIIPIIIMTIIKRKTKHFITFFFLHFLLILACFSIFFFLGSPVFLIAVYTIFLIAATIFSIRSRYNSEQKVLSLSHFILGELLILIFYIIAALNSFIFAKSLIIFIEILFSLIFLIYFQLARTDKLLQWEEQSTSIIDKKIHAVKKYFTAGICILLGIITWIVLGTGLVRYLDSIENFFLIKMYSLFHSTTNVNMKSNPVQALPSESLQRPAMLDAISGKTAPESKLSIYILKLLGILIFAVAAFFLIKMLLNICKSIYHGFYENTYTEKEERESVFSIDDTSKRFLKSLNTLKNKLTIPFDMSSRVKIRKLYEKMVIKYKGNRVKILNSYTPGEVERAIVNENYFFTSEITELYEKARYSNEDISKEDFEMMKRSISCLYKGRGFKSSVAEEK